MSGTIIWNLMHKIGTNAYFKRKKCKRLKVGRHKYEAALYKAEGIQS